MKKALLDILTDEMILNHNIQTSNDEIFLKNGDNRYSFRFGKMGKVFKDGEQAVVIQYYEGLILVAKFFIFEETLELRF